MEWEENEWADSEWTSAEPAKEEVKAAFDPIPKGSPAAVLTPEIDDIHAWEDVLEERSSPRPTSKEADKVEGEDQVDTGVSGGASVLEASEKLQEMQLEDSEVEDEADLKTETDFKSNGLGLAPPVSLSTISVDDPHWGSDVEAEPEVPTVLETEKPTSTTAELTEPLSETTTEDAVAVKPISPIETEEEVWGKPEAPVEPASPVAELKEGWGESDSESKTVPEEVLPSTESDLKTDAALPIEEDEGWGDGGDEGGDWGDFEEGDGFEDPEPTTQEPATQAPVAASIKKTAVPSTDLEFPQPLEELVSQLRGSDNAKSTDTGDETPILSYREKSRKLYNSLIRPNCQFIESKRAASEDNVIKWKGSEFEQILRGEIKKLHENDSKNLKRVFKFGWSNGGAERSGSRGRPLSMPPPRNNESPVQIPGLSRSSTMSRASTASPAPPSGGLARSSSMRERGRDMTRNKPPGLVQTAIAGAVGQRVASSSPSMSPAMSPTSASHHHHHALSSVFGSSKSKSHSKSSSVSSISSPLDSPIDSPMDSPLGSPILTNLAPTLSPTLTATPPSGPSRTATPVNNAPPVAAPEEDSFADFVSATPVASTHNSPIASPKIGSPLASPLGSQVTSPKIAHPQISSPLATNGNTDLMGLDMLGTETTTQPAKKQSPQTTNELDDIFGGSKQSASKPVSSPLDDFFSAKPAPTAAVSKSVQSPLDDIFGSVSEKPSSQPVQGKSALGISDGVVSPKPQPMGDQLDDFFGSSAGKSVAPAPSAQSADPYNAKSSDFDIFDAPKPKVNTQPTGSGQGSEFDIFNSAPTGQASKPPSGPIQPTSTGLSGFEIFDKPSSTPSIQIDSSQAEDDEWGDFTDSVATTNRPRKNSYNSAAEVTTSAHNIPSSQVAQSISQSSTQSLFDTTFLDSAMAKRQKSKSPSRSPVAPMKLAKKPVAFELDMGPLQPGSKYKQQSEDKLVNDIVSSLPNLDFMAST